MKTVEIIGYNRANLGKSEAKRLRAEGMVPCVIYGGEEQIHFYAPAILFRDLIYTDQAHFVHLNIEGREFEAILQDTQYHPVSETLLHADFLQMFEGKHIKMNIPVHFEGNSPGVAKGGTLIKKRRHLAVKALPKHLPDFITVDLGKLDFGRALKVGEIEENNFEILDSKIASVAVVEIPRALRGKTSDEEEEEAGVEGEEAPAAEGGEAPAAEGAAE